MFSSRFRKKLETFGLILCVTLVVVAYQNCKNLDNESGVYTGASSRLSLRYLNNNSSSQNLHGPMGEFVARIPEGESFVGVLSDVGGGAVNSALPAPLDGVEDLVTYAAKYQYDKAATVTTVSDRSLKIRSGRDTALIREISFPDYTMDLHNNLFPEIKVIEDINSDGVKDILIFVSRGASPNPLPTYQAFSEGIVLSGKNFAQLKSFRIQERRPLYIYGIANIVGDAKADIIFQVQAGENDTHTTSFVAYNFQETSNLVAASFDLSPFVGGNYEFLMQFDFNDDGQIDLAFVDYQNHKVKAYSMGQFTHPVFEKDIASVWSENSSVKLEDMDFDGEPEIAIYKYNNIGSDAASSSELYFFKMKDLSEYAKVVPHEGKFFSSLFLTADADGNNVRDVIFVQKDLYDLTRKVDKIVIKDVSSGRYLYEIVPSARENSNYANSHGALIKSQP